MRFRTMVPAPFLGLGRDLDRLMLENFDVVANDSWVPPVDVHDDQKSLVFTVELPGVTRDEVDVSFKDGVLTIAGKKNAQRTEELSKGLRLEERSYGSFRRSFRLPADVDPTKIDATHTNGVLTVTVARKEATTPAKIEIRPA